MSVATHQEDLLRPSCLGVGDLPSNSKLEADEGICPCPWFNSPRSGIGMELRLSIVWGWEFEAVFFKPAKKLSDGSLGARVCRIIEQSNLIRRDVHGRSVVFPGWRVGTCFQPMHPSGRQLGRPCVCRQHVDKNKSHAKFYAHLYLL